MFKTSTLFSRGLTRTRLRLHETLGGWLKSSKVATANDAAISWQDFEEAMLMADVGGEVVEKLKTQLQKRVLAKQSITFSLLKEVMQELIKPLEQPLRIPPSSAPFVIMMVGVNGAGKTTSVAKLANYFLRQGHSLMLAGADTYRAAAESQLKVWSERNGVRLVSRQGGDPAAVAFDAYDAAAAAKCQILLVDTAGRLTTQKPLMDELVKIRRTLARKDPSSPHEILLVLDGSSGQNLMSQTKNFHSHLGITGIMMTKLDGTAKGGALARLIQDDQVIPVRFIGVGEALEDIEPFASEDFVESLFGEEAA